MTKKNPTWDEKNFIWDEETQRWYINEFHLQHTKACLESNRRLQARLPLSHEEVVANIARIYSMDNKKEVD